MTRTRATSIAALCWGLSLVVACSSGDDSSGGGAAQNPGQKGSTSSALSPEELRKLAEEGKADEIMNRTQQAIRDQIKQARGGGGEAVPLPSVRRLRSFLPETLPGRDVVDFDTNANARYGMCQAEGNYRTTGGFNNLEVRVRFLGKENVMRQGMAYKLKEGKESEINGFPAYLIEPDSGDREIFVKLTDRLYVQAEGPMGFDELTAAAGTVDLAGLKKQLESGELFKPGFEDRLAEAILSRGDIEKLLPKSLGPLTVNDGRSRREVDKVPMQSSVEARVSTGRLKIQDFGTAEKAKKAVPQNLNSDQTIQRLATQYEITTSESERDGATVYQLVGTLKNNDSLQSVVYVRVFHGRFVVNYNGNWAPAREIKEDSPFAAQLKEQMKKMGVGIFPNVEAQIAAVLDALPFDAMKTLNETEI